MAELGSLFDIFPCPVSPESISSFSQGSRNNGKGLTYTITWQAKKPGCKGYDVKEL